MLVAGIINYRKLLQWQKNIRIVGILVTKDILMEN